MTMQTTVVWQPAQTLPTQPKPSTASAIRFVAQTGSGHTIALDSSEEQGCRPMELILTGLGGCASYDVVSILQKSREAIHSVSCQVSGERADSVPAVFTHIHLHFEVAGSALKEEKVKKALALSIDKYCSASAMLAKSGAVIDYSYTLTDTAMQADTPSVSEVR